MNAARAAQIPAVGIVVQVPLNHGKDQRDRAQLDKELEKNARYNSVKGDMLAADEQGDKDCGDDDEGKAQVEASLFDVDRKKTRADKWGAKGYGAVVLPIAGGQKDGVAAALENRLLLGFGQRATECGFFIFHLRTNVFGKLSDDVFALRLGETLANSIQVAVE